MRILGALLVLLLFGGAAQAQNCPVPNTFINGTIIDANQVNANFAALTNCAINAVHVAPNSALAASSSATFPNGVWRDDFSANLGAPPLFYVNSGSPCSAPDNANQVISSDGKCWVARFSSGNQDIREWGCAPGAAGDVVPCMTAAVAALGSAPIHLPVGLYQLKSAATFTTLPNFWGDGWGEYNQAAVCPSSPVKGTWLHEATAMQAVTPFTISGSASAGQGGFRNMAFCQDHPSPGGGWAPNVYNQIFQLTGVSGEFDFADLYFYAVYQGIVANGGAAQGRFHFKNIRGQTFFNLLNADNIQDVLHFSGEMHIWDFWSNNANVLSWQQTHGNVIQLGRVDGAVFEDFFALGYQACIQITPTASGVTTYATFASLYCDLSKTGLLIQQGPANGNSAVHIANAQFGGGSIAGSWGVNLTGSTMVDAIVQIGTLHVVAMGGGAVEITAAGGISDPNKVTIGSILATNINQDNNGSTLFSATTGNVISLASTPFLDGANNGAQTVNTSVGGVYEIPTPISWTPGIAGDATAGTPTYTTQVGWYSQHGSALTLSFLINLASFGGSPTGNTIITNLPRAASGAFVLPGLCQISFPLSGITMDTGYLSLSGAVNTNQSVINVYEMNGGSGQSLPVSKVGGTAIISGQCTYQVATF